ncbi:MAG: S8 family peptidase [Chromatiales bacterium]|jgi:serine protease|nr:S8 family peptidase [Chromatiales bacterium]MDX9766285.1 S8 family peptidase [Ectothiorhodospiraceae bacterium]
MRRLVAYVLSLVAAALCASALAAPPSDRTDRLIVRFAEDVVPDAARLQALSEPAGRTLVHLRSLWGGREVLRLPEALPLAEVEALSRRIAARPGVLYAEPDRIVRPLAAPNDPLYAQQWNLQPAIVGTGTAGSANVEQVWAVTTGNGVVVAVIDTGILPHQDLSLSVFPADGTSVVSGYDFVSEVQTANDGDGRDGDPRDPGDWITAAEALAGVFEDCEVGDSSWHGTLVSGVIAASRDNAIGIAGIGSGLKILPVRALGKCGGYLSDVADGIRWAAGLAVPGVPANANPAAVINLSLGSEGACGNTERDAIDAAIAAGRVVVAAAGNSAANVVDTPGSCPGVIAVTAVASDGSLADYSSYGAQAAIAAPGGDSSVGDVGIATLSNSGTTTPSAGTSTYAYAQGTSFATPHVAAAAGLMRAVNPTLTPTQVRNLLTSSARPFPSTEWDGTEWDCNRADIQCGAGLLDVYAAVLAACDAPGGGCAPVATYKVGGNASGLSGTGLSLRLNGGSALAVAAAGPFQFPQELADGTSYSVTVASAPSGQTCIVGNGSGVISGADVTNVSVTCGQTPTYSVGGSVTGLQGGGLRLRLNGGNELAISGSGSFTFTQSLASGSSYVVSVSAQPTNPSQICVVNNGSGTIASASVNNVAVSCAPQYYRVGGTVSGLSGGGLTLRLNGGNDLAVAANGTFTFAPWLPDGTSYGVSVATQPSGPAQTCTVNNGSGTLNGANVSNVGVVCVTDSAPPPAATYTVGGTVAGMQGSGLVLRLSAGGVTDVTVGNGGFAFPNALADGTAYTVTVAVQPVNPAQTCVVGNGSGVVSGANVTNVLVDCPAPADNGGGGSNGGGGGGGAFGPLTFLGLLGLAWFCRPQGLKGRERPRRGVV